jgi:hypothetical protein
MKNRAACRLQKAQPLRKSATGFHELRAWTRRRISQAITRWVQALFTLTLNEEKAADKKLSLLAKSINVKAKAEKPPGSVKTAVKESAKLPVKIPSGGQREVQGIESNMEAKQSQPE